MPTARMDSFYHSEYQASQNVEAPTTAPSTEEESLLVDNYNYAHRPPSNESTDLSTANSPFGSDKPGGHWNTLPNVPVQYAGAPLTHRVRPLHPNLPWPQQDDSQYGIGPSMPSMPAEGSFPPPQPYQDTINNDDVFGYLGEHYDGNQALNTTFVPSTPLPTYGSRTNVPQIRSTEQQLSTSYSSPPDTLGRSSSGNKRKRVGVDQWQPVDSMLPVGQPLTPAGEQVLSIWHQTRQRMPMEGELVALSVVTGAAERAITYWLSCHRSPPFPVPMTLPIPPSSGSSSNNVPTTPTPTASSRKNTCNVKKRVPKPWNKAWDEEKPYSCLCRCGWTFTKKGDWIKHEKINFPEHTFHCPVPDCRSNFGRKDKCRDHIRKVHKISQTEQFDLDSRRTSVAQDHNDRCGFCGHFCTSWQEWYDHVGAHFENRIEGGPWTMSMWRYPWIHDAEAGHGDEGPDDGNDPDNGGNDDSEKDAEHETDDSFNGYEGGGPSHGSKRGGGDSGGRQSRFGGGRSGFQHMGAKYCTRSSHPPAPSVLSEALKAASRTNSMPQLNQQQPRRRTKKTKKQDQLKMNHPITWPLTEEQAIPKVAPGSSMRTERINPLIDLAVAGKSARDAHIAELAPYLEDKAQVVSQPSLQGKPDEAPTQTTNLSVMNVSSHMDVTSEDFDELNGRKHQGLLDCIDDLRSQGVFDDLPQLVVCGDQSSGKSSIIEAITGIPFPRKDIQSTRFATEVILKPKDDYSLLLSIDPAAERSLSRRVLKGKAPLPVQRCSNCDKEFKRPCDLTKHEKTHSRPWKCENEECKYHTLGWPTEKERDRHMNDKHSEAAALYPLCGYQFNRKNLFRQHMEKAHNSQSVRFQNNGWNSKKLIKDGPTGIKHKDLQTQEEPRRTPRPLADATESVRTRQPTVDVDHVRRQAESLREKRLNYGTERHKTPEVIAPPIPPDPDVGLRPWSGMGTMAMDCPPELSSNAYSQLELMTGPTCPPEPVNVSGSYTGDSDFSRQTAFEWRNQPPQTSLQLSSSNFRRRSVSGSVCEVDEIGKLSESASQNPTSSMYKRDSARQRKDPLSKAESEKIKELLKNRARFCCFFKNAKCSSKLPCDACQGDASGPINRPTDPLKPTIFRRLQSGALDSFFSIDKVFQTLWTEPIRRRWLVITGVGTHSWCIPIKTYGGKGTANINLSSHSIIYTPELKPSGPRKKYGSYDIDGKGIKSFAPANSTYNVLQNPDPQLFGNQPSLHPCDDFRVDLIRRQRKPNTIPCPETASCLHSRSSRDSSCLDCGQIPESREPANATARPSGDSLGELNQGESNQDSRAILGTNNAISKTSRTSRSFDIWSLGCIFYTAAALALGTEDALKISRDLRGEGSKDDNHIERAMLYINNAITRTPRATLEFEDLKGLIERWKISADDKFSINPNLQYVDFASGIYDVGDTLQRLKQTVLQAEYSTEMRSVANMFAPTDRDRQPCQTLYLSSTKASVGYGGAASGVTALIKSIRILRKEAIRLRSFHYGVSILRQFRTQDLFTHHLLISGGSDAKNWLSPPAFNLKGWPFHSLLGACKELEHLHKLTDLDERSYSHLDLKPANILVSDPQTWTITDFGRTSTACRLPKAMRDKAFLVTVDPWSPYFHHYKRLIALFKSMIIQSTDQESLDLDFQKDDHTALDLEWLKQIGLEPGALESIETAAHSFNQLPSSIRGLLYVLAYLDPQKLSGYLMESASLATWPQCVTDASNHGVSEMLLRLINESLDRYARGVAGAMKDHIIEIDSDIDNVKSKIPTIYSSRQVPTTELHKTEYPLVNDRRIIRSSSGGIETRSEVTEFAGHLASDEPFAEHHAVQLIDGSMMGIPHHEVVRQERETSLKKSIFDATVSGDLELLETLISEGSRSTQQSPWHQRTGNLKNLPLLDIQSLEDLLQLVEEQKLGSAATTILSAAVRFYRQDRLKTSNHNEEAGDDGGKKEPVLGGNSLEQEYPTIAGSPMGRVLDVSRPRSSLIGTREQDAGDERSAQMRF